MFQPSLFKEPTAFIHVHVSMYVHVGLCISKAYKFYSTACSVVFGLASNNYFCMSHELVVL